MKTFSEEAAANEPFFFSSVLYAMCLQPSSSQSSSSSETVEVQIQKPKSAKKTGEKAKISAAAPMWCNVFIIIISSSTDDTRHRHTLGCLKASLSFFAAFSLLLIKASKRHCHLLNLYRFICSSSSKRSGKVCKRKKRGDSPKNKSPFTAAAAAKLSTRRRQETVRTIDCLIKMKF